MKNPLMQRIPRELKTNFGRYFGMFLILVVTIMVGTGFQVVCDSASETLDDVFKTCNVEDGYFETGTEATALVREVLAGEKVSVYENFYYVENEFDGGAKLKVFRYRSEVDLVRLFEGHMPERADEVLLDRLVSKNHNAPVGSRVTLDGQEYVVCGTAAFSDYSSLFKSNSDLMMDTMNFGVAMVSDEGFSKLSPDDRVYRYSYIYEDDSMTKAEHLKADAVLRSRLLAGGVPVSEFLSAENNQSIQFIRMDMGKDGPMMKILVYIFIVVLAFVFVVLTNHTIEAEAAVIGTLRAQGFRRWEIIRHYMAANVLISVAASLIGNVLGYTLMLKPFTGMYYMLYSMPPIKIRFNPGAFLLTTVLPMVIMITVNAVMLYRKLSLSPLKFLRRDLKKRGQKRAVRLPKLSFASRFRLRVILQNKGNYCMLFIGVFLASFLLMFGMGIKPLVTHYSEQMDRKLNYEYQYILKLPYNCDGGERTTVYSMETYFARAKKDMEISLIGVGTESDFFGDVTLPMGSGELTVSLPVAKKLGLKKGDRITLKDELQEREYTFTVSALSDYEATMAVFLKKEELNRLLGLPDGYYNCYISNEKLSIPDSFVGKQLTRADITGAVDRMMDSFDTVILYVNIFAVAVYMILMYLLTKVVIEKNAISISFLKVFGYNDSEIRRIYLNANAWVVILSLVICIPIELLAFKGAMYYALILMEGYLPFYAPWYLVPSIVLIGIAAYFTISGVLVRKIRRIPGSEALKNRE